MASRRTRRLGLAAALACSGAAAGAAPLQAPYKDVSQFVAPGGPPRIAAQSEGGATRPLPDLRHHGRTLIWAFATGECGAERWGDFDSAEFASLNVGAFVAAGVDYIVSTGGEAGAFTCANDEGMRRFVARYDSKHLVGIDFDIERQQTPQQVDSLVARAKAVQLQRPGLRLSFTLATHAAADGSGRSLNTLGETVLDALRRHGLDTAVLNLMVMNYGPADARWCVLREGVTVPACDMGRSALQAARNVHLKYDVPLARIALTVMPGENDVAGNVFTLADAAVLVPAARELGLAGWHWWSLDRDRPCPAAGPRVSPRCHGLAAVPAGAFERVLSAGR